MDFTIFEIKKPFGSLKGIYSSKTFLINFRTEKCFRIWLVLKFEHRSCVQVPHNSTSSSQWLKFYSVVRISHSRSNSSQNRSTILNWIYIVTESLEFHFNQRNWKINWEKASKHELNTLILHKHPNNNSLRRIGNFISHAVFRRCCRCRHQSATFRHMHTNFSIFGWKTFCKHTWNTFKVC